MLELRQNLLISSVAFKDVERLMDMISGFLELALEDKQYLLEADSLEERPRPSFGRSWKVS